MDQLPIYVLLEKKWNLKRCEKKRKIRRLRRPWKRLKLDTDGLILFPWQDNSFKMDQTHARARNKYNSQKTGGTDPDLFLLVEMHKRPGNGSLNLKAV